MRSAVRWALAAMVAGLLVWQWAWISGWLLRPLYVAADLLWPDLMPGGLMRVDAVESGWRVHTGWPIAEPDGGLSRSQAIFFIVESKLRYSVLGMAVLLVLAIGASRPMWWRLAWAELLLWLSAGLGLTLQAWVMCLVLQYGPQVHDFSSEFGANYRLALPAPPLWQVVASVVTVRAYWLAFPVCVPLLLWWWVCPQDARAVWALVWRRLRPLGSSKAQQ